MDKTTEALRDCIVATAGELNRAREWAKRDMLNERLKELIEALAKHTITVEINPEDAL